ncbi:MAG: carbohydrate porin [Pseudomonadota bacterium]
MEKWDKKKKTGIAMALSLSVSTPALAYEVTEQLNFGSISSAVVQYGDFEDVFTEEGKKRDAAAGGSFATDLWINFHPTEVDEFQMTLSYAAGNALNNINPFTLALYADDLEEDLKNINGRNRNYFLESWYKHTLEVGANASLGVTVGIIDSTVYIDENVFANDEISQFMNDTFVNSILANLPSYDGGGILEFESGNWQLKAVIMNSRNESERSYMYYSGQASYKLESTLGEGNYRINGYMTSGDFMNAAATSSDESLKGFGFSADQQLTEHLGVFARLGWQDDAAAVDHDQLYCGGVNINGGLWSRIGDEIGIGYAYLKGAQGSGLDRTQAFETYVRFAVLAYADFTLDIQYILDSSDGKDGASPEGTIIGGRLSSYF